MNGTEQKIQVIKQEMNNINNVTIDIVTNSSYNGWIKRQINYNAEQRGYSVERFYRYI
jgi:predicted SPOUT superfamily RNA methylase MTH1